MSTTSASTTRNTPAHPPRSSTSDTPNLTQTVQQQPAKQPVLKGFAAFKQSLKSLLIEKQKPNDVRAARAHNVHVVVDLADKKLDVLCAEIRRNPYDAHKVQKAGKELKAAFAPLVSKLEKESKAGESKEVIATKVLGLQMNKRFTQLQAHEVDSLAKSLGDIVLNDPKNQDLIDMLAIAAHNAQLQHAKRNMIQLPGGNSNAPLNMRSVADLTNTFGLEEPSRKLLEILNRWEAGGKPLPLASFKKSTLQAMHAKGLEAATELDHRIKPLAALAKATDALATKDRRELSKTAATLEEFFSAGNRHKLLVDLHKRIVAKIQEIDDQVTLKVLGTGDLKVEGMKLGELSRIKNRIKKQSKDYLPPALQAAQGLVEGALVTRRASRREAVREEGQKTFSGALNKALVTPDPEHLRTEILGCAGTLLKTTDNLKRLGDSLKPEEIQRWIEGALRNTDLRTLENVQRNLNTVDGQTFRATLAIQQRDSAPLASQFIEQLHNYLNQPMRGSQTPRRL